MPECLWLFSARALSTLRVISARGPEELTGPREPRQKVEEGAARPCYAYYLVQCSRFICITRSQPPSHIRGRAEVKRLWRTTNLLANRRSQGRRGRGLYGAARRKRKRVKPFAAQYILMTVASQPGHKDFHPSVASFSRSILLS